ncbi:hypothetical protein PAHAL_8G253600 [Panicum hallii]|uniref:Uncharacterized protein n=1 Tax=Panicum hallii TaxID=206008 RepID=A0A2T8IA91_9POAL|nr:hypothetical protein PAHAL_8G253600 [Panicum hallii]
MANSADPSAASLPSITNHRALTLHRAQWEQIGSDQIRCSSGLTEQESIRSSLEQNRNQGEIVDARS